MTEVTNLIKVGDAVLTPHCLERLTALQENRNERLEGEIDVFKDAIILLTLAEFHDDNRREKKRLVMDSLAHIIELHEQLGC